MNQLLKNNLSLISFILIPLIYLWHPNWLSINGIQPYWPLFWLLPWSMINGSLNGLAAGLFLGLALDAISTGNSFSQIPGLIFCGFWFGKFRAIDNFWVGHFRYGLICCMGSFLCGFLYLFQIFIKDFSDNNFYFFTPGFKIIFAQLFLTGFFAPFFCSQLLRIFKVSKNKKFTRNLSKN